MPRLTLPLIGAALAIAVTQPLPVQAQTASDTAAVAQAMASTIADSILSGRTHHLIWYPCGPLLHEVASRLRGQAVLEGVAPPLFRTRWLRIVSVRMGADTTEAVIETADAWKVGSQERIDMYRTPFSYARTTGGGWRLVRTGATQQLLGGAVRGD